MPRLSRYLLRTSLLYLLLGTSVGSLILMQKGRPFAPFVWTWLPIHMDSMLIGWMTQFALGVAFWILPRLESAKPRGEEKWSWATFFLLNAGIWISWIPEKGMLLLARLMETVAIFLFLWGNWPRLYPSLWERKRFCTSPDSSV